MKKNLVTGLLLIFCLAIFLGGCSVTQHPQIQTAGYEVQDTKGYIVKLSQKPQRIVSLTLGTDEILMSLVPKERIAALTYLADDGGISNIAEEAKQVPAKIRANAETIIGLEPDLVIVADWQPAELIQIIRDAGIAVYVYKTPNTIAEIKQVVAEIAQVVGEEETGKKMAAAMDKELASVKEALQQIPADKRQTVVRFSLMGGSGGQGSLFDDICNYAGVGNGASRVGLGKNDILSKEQIVEVNPDLFILPTWDYTGKTDMQKFKTDVQNDLALQTVKAVRQQKLIQIPDRHLTCSSQYIVYGVKDLAMAAYPEYLGRQ